MILLAVSLLAGVLTVLAPCTISLLPVIVGGTLSGGSSIKRIVVVTASLGVSVVAFTLLLKATTALIAVPQGFWQGVSGIIIIALGIAMIFPRLWDAIPFLNAINKESNKALATGYQSQNFTGDILTGAALGPVFSSCSPTYFLILATVLPRSIPEGLIYLVVYAIGLCGGLFVVALAGQKLLEWLGVASDPNGWIKRAIGIVFLALGVAILFGYDKQLEVYAAEHFFDVTQVEQKLLAAQASPASPATPAPQASAVPETPAIDTAATTTAAPAAPHPVVDTSRSIKKALTLPKAPEISKPSGYVNTGGKPITIGEFKGKKVVLVDFWTYSCINCQRTLPYMKAWDVKYRDLGLQIIGIHTPEFAFEHVQSNVETAVQGFGLKYPSVLDNDYGTWNAFGNSYWPRKYLVDIDGYIVYDHAGEGNYAETEHAIQKALQERADALGTGETIPTDIADPKAPIAQAGSPETYFGSSRDEYLANGNPFISGKQSLTVPAQIGLNKLYLGGTWDFSPEYAEAGAGATITYRYAAKGVYFVAASKEGATISVSIDGKTVSQEMAGDDVLDGVATIKGNRLYKLIESSSPESHVLEIKIEKGVLDAYTFTFG
jgi:cytochrome c biogenesis protein CcdA/thiol-disulfide isomerase/thioredoxin